MLTSTIALTKSVLRKVGLLPYAKRAYGALMRADLDGPLAQFAYRLRTLAEQANFSEVEVVHDLPAVHHYWSGKYLTPQCEALGFSDTDGFYLAYAKAALLRAPGRAARMVSIGAGNGDLEARLAGRLLEEGFRDFRIECLEMNQAMLDRCAHHAQAAGVSGHVVGLAADFNVWEPATKASYQCVIANQSLHHVVKLEHLFASIEAALTPSGLFLSADMIGRNGHQRWPEVRAVLDEYWRALPRSLKYNRQLKRFEDEFQDWDCSVSGFEGIRAQDVLPLLVERFGFEVFLGFGGLIDPFIDRGFGPNYDVANPEHLRIIDAVAQRNEEELVRGTLKPTQMYAVMSREKTVQTRCRDGLTPASAVRRPADAAR